MQPTTQRQSAVLSILVIVITAITVAIGLGNAFLPLLIATFMAYLVLPLVKRLEGKGISKMAAVSTASAIAVLFTAIALALVIPVVVQDLKAFLHALPGIAETAIHRIDAAATRWGVSLPLGREELIAQASAFSKSVGLVFGKALSGVMGLILSVLNFLLIPIFFFYLIAHYDGIVAGANSLIPPRNRPWFERFLKRSNDVLSGYFRGQILVAVILGVLYGTGFWAVGLRFGFVIGLMTGLLNVIPYAGPLIGLGLATVVALANFEGVSSLAGVWIVFAVVQGLEGFVVTPRIVGDRVGLNALETMIALIVGGNIAGFVGMLIAIPAAGVLKFVLAESKAHYLKSDWYLG